MTRPRVYVESTIQSLYFEIRSSPDMIARREWTRQWWAVAADRYSLVTSPAVLDELAGGDAARSAERLELVRDPAIDEIREVRQRISARFAHDPARLVEYFVELQEQYRDRLVDRAPDEDAGQTAA